MKKYLLIVIVSILLFSCGEDDPVQPDPSFLDGKWSAEYLSTFAIDDKYDSLQYTIDIVESNGVISGTAYVYYVKYQSFMGGTSRVENTRNGVLIGELDGNKVSFRLEDDEKYPFTGELNSDSTEIAGFVKVKNENNNDSTEINLNFTRLIE